MQNVCCSMNDERLWGTVEWQWLSKACEDITFIKNTWEEILDWWGLMNVSCKKGLMHVLVRLYKSTDKLPRETDSKVTGFRFVTVEISYWILAI